MDTKNRHWATIDGKGIRYSHSYSLLDARVIELENGYKDIILLLRNPWGKDNRGSNWRGDWSDGCDLWNKHTKKQIDLSIRKTTDSKFWMSIEDFIKFFKSLTINYANFTWSKRIIPGDI